MMSDWNRKDTFERKGKYPCKGCTDRKVGCHSVCEAFLAEKSKANALGEVIRNKRAEEAGMVDYIVNRIVRVHNEVYHGGCKRWNG